MATDQSTVKPWYQSITIWGASVVAVLQVLPTVISWADTTFGVSLATNPMVMKVLTIAAAAVAIWGRLKANSMVAGFLGLGAGTEIAKAASDANATVQK